MTWLLATAMLLATTGPVRPPTPAERARVVRAVDETWEYESDPAVYVNFAFHLHLRRPRLHPEVVRIAVSRTNPRFAAAVVELEDRHGRRRGRPAVLVLDGSVPLAAPAQSFSNACTAATAAAVRALLCPDPWHVLGYPRPRVRVQTALTQRIPSADLHRVDWRRVVLPGGACGSSQPIRRRRTRLSVEAFIHPDVDLVWWNPVVVSSWTPTVYGDLDGDGRDEAAVDVGCANGGGMAAGQLRFSSVIFMRTETSLSVVGIVTPQQPLVPGTSHTPLSRVVAIRRGRVVVDEFWYGANDGTCCASGRARTVWTYRGGRLVPHTTILRRPR